MAALEACLFLRAFLRAEDLEIEMLTPNQHFAYRPLSVLEPFGDQRTWSLRLDRFATDNDVALGHARLAEVDATAATIVTDAGERRSFDLLLVAVGARPTPELPGALTFQGSVDAPRVRRLLDDAAAHLRPRVVFAVGGHATWPLPLYELALLTAAELDRRGAHTEITLVTPETAPLELFGRHASDRVAAMLQQHGIATELGAEPLSVEDGELRLVDGRTLPAECVVALPRAAGRFVTGLPHDGEGFIPVDAYGRVAGLDGVFAAGDITACPFKQGGLAAQQADAAAETMLAALGLPIAPRPVDPVLRGVLYTDDDPTYMRRRLSGGEDNEPRAYSLWWPPSKIAGRYLSPYLTVQAGAPRAPEVRPGADVVPVEVDTAARADVGSPAASTGRAP